MKIINLEQGSQEWLNFRKVKIGASDAATILDSNPWCSRTDLWEQKLGLMEVYVTPSMIRGTNMEPEARAAYEKRSGIAMTPMVVQHDTLDWMIASLDGISANRKRVVEIKCPAQRTHEIAKQGNVPPYYYAQLQHQMHVTGLPVMDYFSYCPEDQDSPEVCILVEYDYEFCKRMIEEEKVFYDCLMNFEPPEDDKSHYRMDNDEQWISKAKEVYACKNAMDSLQSVYDDLKKELISLSNNISSKGGPVKLTKVMCKGHIAYDKIPELKDIDLNNFRKPSYHKWVINLSKDIEQDI